MPAGWTRRARTGSRSGEFPTVAPDHMGHATGSGSSFLAVSCGAESGSQRSSQGADTSSSFGPSHRGHATTNKDAGRRIRNTGEATVDTRNANLIAGRPARGPAAAGTGTVELSRDWKSFEHFREQGESRHLSSAHIVAQALVETRAVGGRGVAIFVKSDLKS